jgi:hexulose-6-phosphate isomerase
LVAVLLPLADLAAKKKVNIALETDLNPKDFRRLLEHLEPAVFTVNYDTGNSASLGFSPVEELEAYSHRISDIHIKDRKLGSGSCVLGTGDTKFGEFFTGLNPGTFHGHFIMQAFRDDEGLAIFAQQLAWVRPKLEAWHRGEGWI